MKYYHIKKINSVKCCRACVFSSNCSQDKYKYFICHIKAEKELELNIIDDVYWWEDACEKFERRNNKIDNLQ